MARPRAGGRVYYLGKVRAWPEIHGQALCDLLAAIEAAGQNETLAILRQLQEGSGFNPAQIPARPEGEDEETRALLDDFLFK